MLKQIIITIHIIALNINNNSSNLLLLKNSGNMGIGISEPESLLHIGKNDSASFLIENIYGDFSNKNHLLSLEQHLVLQDLYIKKVKISELELLGIMVALDFTLIQTHLVM